MAVDLFVEDNNNFILDISSDDIELGIDQRVMVDPNYEHLQNLPKINHVTLIGDKSFEDLGLVEATEEHSGLMSSEDKTTLDNIDETYATKEELAEEIGGLADTYVEWRDVDHSLNSQSTNPIDNNTVTHMFDRMGQDIAGKQDILTFDSTPTEGSTNPVTSDGIYNALISTPNAVIYKGFVQNGISFPKIITLSDGKQAKDIINSIEANKDVYIEVNLNDGYDPVRFRFSGSSRYNISETDYDCVYQFISTYDSPQLDWFIPRQFESYVVELGYRVLNNGHSDISALSISKSTVESDKNKVTSLSASSTDIQYPSAKCVYDNLQTKQDTLTFDSTPTEGSSNPVTSDGIYDAIETAKGTIPTKTSDLINDGSDGTSSYQEVNERVTTISSASTNNEYPTAKAVYDALSEVAPVVIYTGVCDYAMGSVVQTVALNNGKTYVDVIADIEANKTVILRIEDLYMDVYDFVYTGKQNLYNEPPLSNDIAYSFTYDKADDNKCLKILVSNSIQIQKWIDAEVTDNKVTSLSASSTNTQYPSAKCVYDAIQATEAQIPTKTSELVNDGSDNTSTYVEADELATVATSGQYSDLTGQPTNTSDFTNDGSDGTSTYVEADELAAVATSGAYSDLTGQPTDLSDFNNDVGYITSAPVSSVDGKTGTVTILPAGGNAGQILKKNSATDYDVHWANETEIYPSGYCTTAGGTATKIVNCSLWTTTPNTYLHILLGQPNTYAGAITMRINASTAIPVYINGDASSATNYSLPAGSYLAFYDGTNIHLRTDGQLPGSIAGEAAATEAKLATKADSVGASADFAAKLTASIPFGKLDSTSTSTVMTATVPGITELKNGVCMILYNGVVTSAANFTININGLGAKPSYSNMTLGNPVTPTNPTRDTTIFNINYAFLFVYSETIVSGGAWIGYRGYDANTNTIGYQLRTNNSTMPTADKFYRYRLLFTSADGTKWVPANTSTSTNATSARTSNTRAIDPFGEICWYGTTTAIEANANVTAAQLWQQYYGSYTAIGYSFNNTGAAQTMTSNKPIYVKCTPQADGSAVIDPTTPYTQTLPTAVDGKIYIYLGRAVSATLFEILMNHPIYYYDGESIAHYDGHMHIKLLSSSFNISGSIGSATLALDSSLFKELEFDVKGPRTAIAGSTTYTERRRYKVPVSEGGFVISDYNIANAIMNDNVIYWSGTTISNQNMTSPLLPGYTIEQIIGHI